MGVIFGGSGPDSIAAASASDVIFGQSGNDTLSSSFATANLHGGGDQDLLTVDFDYLIAAPGPYPTMQWSLAGDDGNDTLSASVDIDVDQSQYGINYYGPGPTLDLIADGGAGNDLITLDSRADIIGYVVFFTSGPTINNVVTDLVGDNIVQINSSSDAWDMLPTINSTVRLGSGNDQVEITNFTDAYNNAGIANYDIDMGDGANLASISDHSGRFNVVFTAGSGADTVDIFIAGDSGNSFGFRQDIDVTLGAGNDSLSLITSWNEEGYGTGTVIVDLGDGNDQLYIRDGYGSYGDAVGGVYQVFTGSGNDTISLTIHAARASGYGIFNDVDVDLGVGDDTLVCDVFGGAVDVLAGNGNDIVAMVFRADGYSSVPVNVDVGDGTNSLTLKNYGGSTSVAAGSGNDTVDVTWVDGVQAYGAAPPTLVLDLGDGDNTASVAIGAASTYTAAPTAQINTGTGNDTITVNGGAGNVIYAGAGNDTISGSGGIDTIHGGDGDDTYTVDHLSDLVVETNAAASGGADTVNSWLANYTLGANVEKGRIMSAGAANLTGNGLNNALFAGAGNNVIDGGAGSGDAVSYAFAAGPVSVSLSITGAQATGGSGTDTLIGIENLAGSLFDDRLTGSSAANWMTGDAGNDVVSGLAGNDSLRGGDGADTLTGGAGNDLIFGEAGNDFIFYGTGNNGFDGVDGGAGSNDRIVATAGSVTIGLASLVGIEAIDAAGFANVKLLGSTANNTFDFSAVTLTGIASIDAGAGNDTVTGSGGADKIIGGNGKDTINGSAGADLIEGGAGKDILTGGLGADTFDFNVTSHSKGSSIDRISDFTRGTDIIDLATIDANGGLAGDSFAFIGNTAFNGVAGQLRYDTTSIAGVTRIFADTNGDRVADMEIQLTGTHYLTASDFLL